MVEPTRPTTTGETDETIREEWRQYDFEGGTKLSIQNLNVHYGNDHALSDVSMDVPERSVTVLIENGV